MNRTYVLTRLAESDLDDTWDYVAQNFGFDVADHVLTSLRRAFQLLGEHPGIGHGRLDLAPHPYKFWRVGPSLVAYRPDTRPVRIIRVTRSEREWTGLLPSE